MRCYELIEVEKANYPVSLMCRVLKVSRSGYYAWRGREPSRRARADAELGERIRTIHHRSRQTYGAPRIHAELREEHGVRCGRKRVARLMRQAGLEGCHRRRSTQATMADASAEPALDLVQRNFAPEVADRLWVADISYVPTWQGFLYLAVIVDAFSRRVVGWSMTDHLRSELVLDALEMAILEPSACSGAHPPLRPGLPVHFGCLRLSS